MKSKSLPRILCADDDPAIRKLVLLFLALGGYPCASVADGKEALERLTSGLQVFDILITDHEMPRMNGLELVTKLRGAGFPGKIVLHASPFSLAVQSAYEGLRVDGFIWKVSHVHTFLRTIAALHSDEGNDG
jgi:CheY-like chemotaxis protein